MKHLLRQIIPTILLLTSSVVYAEVPVVDAASVDEPIAATSPEPTRVTTDQPNNSGSVGDRLSRLERQMASRNEVDLLSQVQQLQKQVQQLSGQLEVQSHDLKQLQDLQKQQYQDLDQRLNKPSAANDPVAKSDSATASTDKLPKAVKGMKTAANKTAVDAAETKSATVSATDSVMNLPDSTAKNEGASGSDQLQEEKAYQSAYDQLRNRKYKEAKTSLQKFVKKYPSGSYATNAHYWLGELYLLQSQPDQAISEFKTVLKGNPSKAKLADANLKIGFAYYDKGQLPQARTQLQMVKKQYPGTLAAQMANERLQQMQKESV